MSTAKQFRILTSESIRDAFRRRVVTTIIIVTLLSLWIMDGCTSCVPPDLDMNGQTLDTAQFVGVVGTGLFGIVALWTIILGGLLASDHLSETLEDGSASLLLSRPVGRATFALSRLAGSLSVSLATSSLLLVAAALFISIRHGLSLPPAALAAGMTFSGAVVVAALAMTLSLFFKRVATFLLIFFLVGAISLANVQMMGGGTPSGLFALLNIVGPPLATSIGIALAPWSGQEVDLVLAGQIYLRLLVWIAVSVGALVLCFRRIELSA